jgi:hypothetical protein
MAVAVASGEPACAASQCPTMAASSSSPPRTRCTSCARGSRASAPPRARRFRGRHRHRGHTVQQGPGAIGVGDRTPVGVGDRRQVPVGRVRVARAGVGVHAAGRTPAGRLPDSPEPAERHRPQPLPRPRRRQLPHYRDHDHAGQDSAGCSQPPGANHRVDSNPHGKTPLPPRDHDGSLFEPRRNFSLDQA